MNARAIVPAMLALALAGCIQHRVCLPDGRSAAVVPPPDWRTAVTDRDHNKLRTLRQVFLSGIAQARTGGFGAQIDGSGRLFDPDLAHDGVGLGPGDYRCRTYTLGARNSDRPPFTVSDWGDCRIEAADRLLRFVEEDGPHRLYGRIYPDDVARAVFLGTRMLPDEATPLHYSRDADRDTIGAVQRLADGRWRLAIPSPAWGSSVEIVEIVKRS